MPEEFDPTKFDTWGMNVIFAVKEYAEGSPWIAIEHLDGPDLPFMRHGGLVGLELKEGTTYEDAQELAGILKERVTMLTFSDDVRPEYEGYVGRGQAFRIVDEALKKKPDDKEQARYGGLPPSFD